MNLFQQPASVHEVLTAQDLLCQAASNAPWAQETLGLGRTDLPEGSNIAISATLTRESNPSIQKIVGSSAVTNSKPTTEVEIVFDACWIKRSKDTTPPRIPGGAF